MDLRVRPVLFFHGLSNTDRSHRFTGSAGQAIISRNNAYLITDSRYWLQAQEQLDSNWMLIPAGAVDGPKDWMDWIVVRLAFIAASSDH